MTKNEQLRELERLISVLAAETKLEAHTLEEYEDVSALMNVFKGLEKARVNMKFLASKEK